MCAQQATVDSFAQSCYELDCPLAACPLCESPEIINFDRDYTGLTISRCGDCGVRFMNPQLSSNYLNRLYADYIPFDQPDFENKTVERTLKKAQAVQLVGRFVRPGRFLSIGCGDGLELWVAQAYGWQVEGFDIDADTTKRAASRYGVRIHSGDLLQLGLPAGSFDCVFMDQVIEHPKYPRAFLTEANRLLKDGGALFLGCPNIGSLSSGWKTWLGRRGLKRRRRGAHYDTFHHLFYYTPRVLKRLLECHFGFEVLLLRGEPKPSVRYPLLEAFQRNLYEWFPALDSSLQLVARKVARLESGHAHTRPTSNASPAHDGRPAGGYRRAG